MPSVSRRSDGTPPRLAALLALSDERDLLQRVGLAREQAAYRRGYREGHARGYRAGFAEAVRGWKVTAGLISGGPTYAELDRRRYPPDGRRSWLIPRPGEDGGQP